MANMKIHQTPATAEAYGAVEAREVIIIILREALRIIVEVQAIAQSPVVETQRVCIRIINGVYLRLH